MYELFILLFIETSLLAEGSSYGKYVSIPYTLLILFDQVRDRFRIVCNRPKVLVGRSEERRVGKECRSRWRGGRYRKKKNKKRRKRRGRMSTARVTKYR